MRTALKMHTGLRGPRGLLIGDRVGLTDEPRLSTLAPGVRELGLNLLFPLPHNVDAAVLGLERRELTRDSARDSLSADLACMAAAYTMDVIQSITKRIPT